MQNNLSKAAFNEALKYIPGGVNSPVRALRSVNADPIFVKKAKGATFKDLDGNKYIDFCLSWGVFILGHANPIIQKPIRKAIAKGTSYGIPTVVETNLAQKIVGNYPSIEKVRMVNSGTEAVMSAIRLARAFTQRDIVVKFDGCYHGHVDHLLVAAGSGVAQLNESSSSGVPHEFTSKTVSLPFNNIEKVKQYFQKNGSNVAAIIVEPIPANMGVILPLNTFLKELRIISKLYSTLLIFDEVITGYRLGLQGAQGIYEVEPDLTALGKIIGGGFPAAAFGGKTEIMDLLAPNGPVYQAGTLSGNPIAMTAGIATLKQLNTTDFYTNLNNKSDWFYNEIRTIIEKKAVVLNQVGSMFTLFFHHQPISNFIDVKNSNLKKFEAFFKLMLNDGIYFAPSAFEANFISSEHSVKQLTNVLNAIHKNIKAI